MKRDEKHLAFIRALPCVICGAEAEAAHVRYSDASRGKVNPGMSRKDDRYVLPLCHGCHRTGQEAQHRTGEREWWQGHGIDPIPVCEALRAVSGDVEAGWKIIREMQKETNHVEPESR